MGKATERRIIRRQEFLARLAASNPVRFREEWNKRVESWLDEVWQRAGKLSDHNGNRVRPAFEVVDEAVHILADCEDSPAIQEAHSSIDALRHEACRALSVHIGRRIYHLNVILNGNPRNK